MNSYQATEQFLRDYSKYKQAVKLNKAPLAEYNLQVVEEALESMSKDEYYDVIVMYYIEHRKMRYIAMHQHCDVSTAFRQKRRLVNELKVLLFPDDVIREQFGHKDAINLR